jgi:hypothetical protein
MALRRLGEVLDEAPGIDLPPAFSLRVLDRAKDRDARSLGITPPPLSSALQWVKSLGVVGRLATVAIVAIAVLSGVEASRAVMPVVNGTQVTAPAPPDVAAEAEVSQLERAMFDLVANETNGRNGREQRSQGGRR